MKFFILSFFALQMSSAVFAKDMFFYTEECSKQSQGDETVMVCSNELSTLRFYVEGCSKASAGVKTLIRCDLDTIVSE